MADITIRQAIEADFDAIVALNAADEIAVAAFLESKIRFDQIPRIIEETLKETTCGALESIHKVLEADADARRTAQQKVLGLGSRPRATSFV